MNKKIILIAFVIYTYFFCNLGNTIYRISESGIPKLSVSSLFTEGFIGPLRTGLLLLRHNTKSFFPFVSFEFFRLSNPYSALFFTYYIFNIIKQNF